MNNPIQPATNEINSVPVPQPPTNIGDLVWCETMPLYRFIIVDFLNEGFTKIELIQSYVRLNQRQTTPIRVTVPNSAIVLPAVMALRQRNNIAQRLQQKTVVIKPIHSQRSTPIQFDKYYLSTNHRMLYRWTQTHRHCWPTINQDIRLLHTPDDPRVKQGRCLISFLPSSGIPINSYNDASKFKLDSFNVVADALPERETDRFLVMLLGNCTESVDVNGTRGIARHQNIIHLLRERLETLRALSCVSMEMRWRVEAHTKLWRHIYFEIMRCPFPISVLNRRCGQYSPKALVLARVMRDPKCRCGKRTQLIHPFTQDLYCLNCLNYDVENEKLDVTGGSYASAILSSRSAMSLDMTSPYSGKKMTVFFTEDLRTKPNPRSLSSNNAIEPGMMMEYIYTPGKTITCTGKVNPESCLLETIRFKNKNLHVRHSLIVVASYQKQKLKDIEVAQRTHQVNLNKLVRASTGITTKNVTVKKRTFDEAIKQLSNDNITLKKGTIVTIKKSSRGRHISATVVSFSVNKAPLEYYTVQVERAGSDPEIFEIARDRIVLNKSASKEESKKKSKN